jgi:hypothetical protein
MRKGLFGICLTLAIAVALITVFVPSCTGAPKGTIEVKATLCGNPWPAAGDGAVNYTLTLAGGTSPISGTEVPITYTVDVGTWTCDYVAGGPPDAFLVDITPSGTQTVSDGDTITFTLNFELKQDAWIEWLAWTVDGVPLHCDGETCYAEVMPCQIIDLHFKQGVDGCPEYEVTLNETDKLTIHYDFYSEYPGGPPLEPPPVVWVYVVNDLCAVNKSADLVAAAEKLIQIPSFNGEPLEPPYNYYPLNFCEPAILDVETDWTLEKEIDYLKTISFFGATIDPGMHECVLFDIAFIPPIAGCYHFTVVANGEVQLPGVGDIDPWNNYTQSLPLSLWVCVGPVP